MNSNYVCEKCNKQFKQKGHLLYHVENNACKVYNFECSYCNKGFTTSTSMYRHIRQTCKIKKSEDNNRDEIYSRLVKLEAENAQLKKNMKKMESKISNGSKIINNIAGDMNIDNKTVNHITLIAYGKEDVSKIDKTELLKVFRNGFNSTLTLTETMHFNPEYPEFHNVYISSMKNKYAMMYDGNDWTLVMKDDLIDKMYDDKRNYIEENLDDFLDSLTVSQKNALHRWMDADDDHDYIKKIKNDIKLMLYNKRNMAIKHKSQKMVMEDANDIDDLDIVDNMDNIKVIKMSKQEESSPITIQKRRTNKRAGRPGTKRKIVRVNKNE